ncbi:MAG TPA: DNA polymerase III subunit delta' [Burkholderiaceae bacterium]|nr:DNA polymerase III subunit delta' [Burkholderiaceae bacterium]
MTAAPDDSTLPWLAGPAHDIATRQRGHALLVQGSAGAGVFELALRVARTWLCETAGADAPCGRCTACHLLATNSHPDFLALLPELTQVELGWSVGGNDAPEAGDGEGKAKRKPSKEIRIEAVRDAIAWTQKSSSRGRAKVLLLFPADAMNLVASNALLKTLEEPPEGVRLLLVAEDAERLLPTLRSRCQRLLFEGPTPAQALAWLEGQGAANAPVLLAAAGGQPLAARRLAAEGFDAAAWLALPRRIADGRWEPPAGATIPRLREVLQKLCHDAMAVAAGSEPRYFPAASLPPAAAWSKLADWSQSLARLARHDEHPFNAPLITDSLLAEARAVWAKPRRAA